MEYVFYFPSAQLQNNLESDFSSPELSFSMEKTTYLEE